MARPRKAESARKSRITITPSKEILGFIDARVETKEFANRTHGFERAVAFYKKNERLAKEQLGA
jgi:metal-responsive CopG/Arc/MetJ family transcriptional regulator